MKNQQGTRFDDQPWLDLDSGRFLIFLLIVPTLIVGGLFAANWAGAEFDSAYAAMFVGFAVSAISSKLTSQLRAQEEADSIAFETFWQRALRVLILLAMPVLLWVLYEQFRDHVQDRDFNGAFITGYWMAVLIGAIFTEFRNYMRKDGLAER